MKKFGNLLIVVSLTFSAAVFGVSLVNQTENNPTNIIGSIVDTMGNVVKN